MGVRGAVQKLTQSALAWTHPAPRPRRVPCYRDPVRFAVMLRHSTLWLAFALAAWVCACRTTPDGEPEGPSEPAQRTQPAADHLRLVPAPSGEVATVVRAELAKAHEEGRRLIVYEGAPWCEPCKHFHAAAAKGELDAAFPKLTLLEFDADRDGARLTVAGYTSQYIPLFALPGSDGRALGPKEQGGIKGDNVVPYLTTKLQHLLAQGG
jgi:hypothetical protein